MNTLYGHSIDFWCAVKSYVDIIASGEEKIFLDFLENHQETFNELQASLSVSKSKLKRIEKIAHEWPSKHKH